MLCRVTWDCVGGQVKYECLWGNVPLLFLGCTSWTEVRNCHDTWQVTGVGTSKLTHKWIRYINKQTIWKDHKSVRKIQQQGTLFYTGIKYSSVHGYGTQQKVHYIPFIYNLFWHKWPTSCITPKILEVLKNITCYNFKCKHRMKGKANMQHVLKHTLKMKVLLSFTTDNAVKTWHIMSMP